MKSAEEIIAEIDRMISELEARDLREDYWTVEALKNLKYWITE